MNQVTTLKRHLARKSINRSQDGSDRKNLNTEQNLLSEENLRVFAETGRVVVPDGGGVAEALEQGRRLEDLLGDERRGRGGGGRAGGSGDGGARCLVVDGGEVLHDQFGGLGLAGAALAADDHHLRLVPLARHALVRRGADREQVPNETKYNVVIESWS